MTGPKQFFPVLSPNSIYILLNVMRAADSIDPDVVKAKWESLDTIETLYGKGIISGDQTYGIKNHAVAYPWPYEIMMDGKVSSSGWIDDVSAIP